MRTTAANHKREYIESSPEAKALFRMLRNIRLPNIFKKQYDTEKEFVDALYPVYRKIFMRPRYDRTDIDGEDMAQIAIEKAIKGYRAHNGKFDNLLSYVSTIATNVERDVYNRRTTTSDDDKSYERTITTNLIGDLVVDYRYNPEMDLIKLDARTDVKAAIKILNDLDQQLIILHYWEGMPVKEMAEKFEISPGNVKKRMTLARYAMRDVMLRSGLDLSMYVIGDSEDCQDYYNTELDKQMNTIHED